FKAILASIAVLFIGLIGTSSSASIAYSEWITAFADEEEEFDYDEEAEEAIQGAKPDDLDSSNEGFIEEMEKMNNSSGDDEYSPTGDGWGAILSRVFAPGQYMNDTRQALNPRDRPIPKSKNTVDQLCNVDGSPVLHDSDGEPTGTHGDANTPT